MSDKAWDKINELDKLIRLTVKAGMSEGTLLKIEFISGFEKFNTRPYHNYETWGQGYRVIDEEKDITVEREDLDDALMEWKKQRECEHNYGDSIFCKNKCGRLNPEKRVARPSSV